VWASQFHPEVDGETYLHRFKYYVEGYAATMDSEELDAQFETFQPSPETPLLMPRFLSLVFDWPSPAK
jgi:hypothetical protein